METNDVSLGPVAMRFCERLGVPPNALRAARAGHSVTISAREDWLVVHGELPDGRAVRMHCRHDLPSYVSSFRLLGEDQR